MYKKILAAVNEFTNSEIAARYAITIAKACRSNLSLVFVAEDKISRDVFKHAESALDRVFMVKLPCSVAMVRVVRMARASPKNILVPLRGHITHLDERSCFVARLAQAFHSSVTLFHLARPITSFFHGETLLKPAQIEKSIPKDIEKFTGCLKRYEITHEKRTAQGSVSRLITIEAAHRRNDLIVMGASERSLLKSIISGNPVEDVLRGTPCNLIVLRPRHEHL